MKLFKLLLNKVKNFYELVANKIRNMILLVSNNYIVRIFSQVYTFLGLKLITPFEWYYVVIARRPMYLSIAFLCFSAGVVVCISVIVWCVIYSALVGFPLAILKSPGVYEFVTHTVKGSIDLYRVAWLAAAAQYGPGPVPMLYLYWYALALTAWVYPNIVVFNILIVWYTVLFYQCFALMLKGLITQKPKINLRELKPRHTFLGMIMLMLGLIFFVWCPPMLGFGVPAHFETGNPVDPIDWSQYGCDTN
jgi:hypothetical protein